MDAMREMNAIIGMLPTYADSLQIVIHAPGHIVTINTTKVVLQHGTTTTTMITIMIFSNTISNTGYPDNNTGVPSTTGSTNNSANTKVEGSL